MSFNPISAGVSVQRLVPGGGSLGPRSYFRLIWTSFWTCGTIFEQFIVKGFHHLLQVNENEFLRLYKFVSYDNINYHNLQQQGEIITDT